MFGYTVLHYQNINVTKDCINSIKQITTVEPIVIVDNHSPNNSGTTLKKLYESDPRITVIINEENSGFAIGNNIGYQFLQENYDLDTIVVLNNDIIFQDECFQDIVSSYMRREKVDVCGPDMVTLQNNHQNPLALTPFTDSFLKRRIVKDRIQVYLLQFNFMYRFYLCYKEKHAQIPREKQKSQVNCILHGSCVIYGKRFIDNEKFAFLPITFMYNEEAILYDYLLYKGYKTGYCDEVTIRHLEGASTSTETNDTKEKTIMRFKRNTDSLKQQLKQRSQYNLYR